MRLVHPLALACLIAVAVLAVALVRPSASAGSRPRPVVWVLRCASLSLLVLALAQPQIGHGSAGRTVLVIDRSASIGPRATGAERAWLQAATRDDCASRCEVIQFAGAAKLTAPADGLLATSSGGALDGGETNLQGALQLALGRVGQGGRVVVLSDGVQTTGEASAVAAEARARGVRIDYVALSDGIPDAGVTRVEAPEALHAGDPLSLEVTVRSTVAGRATLSLSRDGVTVEREQVTLVVGDNPFLYSGHAPAPGTYSYEVRVTMPGDRVPQDNALATTVRVASAPKVLVTGADDSTIVAMLQADGMRVAATAPYLLPTAPGAYTGEDAVVLDDVSASQLGEQRALALDAAVRSGTVGLLALGGPHSFSLGRYYHSALQRALPVTSLVPGKLQRRNVALELAIDHSGSMEEEIGEYQKLEMAQAGAQAAARFLAAHDDDLGIVYFDIEPRTLIAQTRLTPGKVQREIDRKIESLTAEGGTDIYKGLEDGVHQLEASHEPYRHMVLMTDGISEGEPGSYTKLLPGLHADHITVSTIALGDEADVSLLRAIAKESGGNYYHVTSLSELPRIFTKEASLNARPVKLHGHIAVSAGQPSPVVSSLAGHVLPELRGNVVTTLKQGAQADLLGQDTGHSPDPVLAQWQYGVGRVATWTPGLSSQWAGQWAKHPQLFADTVRWVERGVGIPALTPSLVPGSTSELQVDTVANADVSLDLAHLTGSLVTSSGATIPLRFTQTAPSHYIAEVPSLTQGVYSYTVSDGATPTSGLLAVPYAAEHRLVSPEDTPLGPLAAATGGRMLSARDPAAIQTSRTALWWWLALAALGCFVAAVALGLVDVGRGGTPPGQRRARGAAPSVPLRTADREVARS